MRSRNGNETHFVTLVIFNIENRMKNIQFEPFIQSNLKIHRTTYRNYNENFWGPLLDSDKVAHCWVPVLGHV